MICVNCGRSINNKICDCCGTDYRTDEEVVRIIDNAPTVEIPENEVNCVLTMFGKCSYNETGCSDCEIKDKIRKALNERPQGEWKFIQGATTQGSLKCPFCDYRDYHNTNSNFCPNCGADMRGEKK